jgi:hypothetical protein
MFPAIVVIRGGRLPHPVVLAHSGVRHTIGNGGFVADVSRDPLVIVYQGLTPASVAAPERSRTQPRYEVAEFFGPGHWHYYGPDDRVVEQPQFERANHFSKLYPATARRPAIWEDPIIRPGGSMARFFTLNDSALRILAGLGVALR